MPSKKKKANSIQEKNNVQSRALFPALVSLTLFFWILYRYLFSFSVLFDETFGKAVFFGLPVMIFINSSRNKKIIKAFGRHQLFRGLLRGLAYGGIIGFVGLTFISIKNQSTLISAPVFLADNFWSELFLAILTAFWESIFFFGFIQSVLSEFWLTKNRGKIIFFSSLIFLLFHLPNILLRFSGLDVSFMIFLLYLFGFGQAILFEREENIYPLIITHTVWGMILLIHF